MIMISACQTVGQKRKENINSGKRKKERAQTQKKKGHMPYMWGVVWGQRKESGERANKSHGGGGSSFTSRFPFLSLNSSFPKSHISIYSTSLNPTYFHIFNSIMACLSRAWLPHPQLIQSDLRFINSNNG
jgi:hypothetical protein